MPPERRVVAIRGTAIELGAFLKWAGAARTGGQAKQMVQEGRVLVNGFPERRRARRLTAGDQVTVAGWGTAVVAAGHDGGEREPAR